jgi:hypothetical protein
MVLFLETKENANLMPCPFCGAQARMFKFEEHGDQYWTAGCNTDNCWFECGDMDHYFVDINLLETMWNRRPDGVQTG